MSKYGYRFYGWLLNFLFIGWGLFSWFRLPHLWFFSSLIITGLGNLTLLKVLERHYQTKPKQAETWPYDPTPSYLSGGDSTD